MKLKTVLLLLATPVLAMTICVSLFTGLMCVALGATFPPLMAIGGPLVCGGEEFGIDSHNYSLPNGERGITRNPYCVDGQSGEKRDVAFTLIIVDTLLYGAIVFILLGVPLAVLLAIVSRSLHRSAGAST